MRRETTAAEQALWEKLWKRRRGGLKFRRQFAIGPFIFDFFCSQVGLAIELDGAFHEQKLDEDRMRQQELERLGLRVLRFSNDQVLKEPRAVIASIESVLQRIAAGPEPPRTIR
jgi:very-short-patch-repair endonuclease